MNNVLSNNFVRGLYVSKEFFGDFLVEPLRVYNQGLPNQEKGWKKAALAIGDIAAKIILGSLAGVGMVVKLTQYPWLVYQNERVYSKIFEYFKSDRFILNSTNGTADIISDVVAAKEIQVSKINLKTDLSTIHNEIKNFNGSFRKVYYAIDGVIKSPDDVNTLQLYIIP